MSSLPISRPWRWATRAASLAACLAFWQLAAGLQLNLGLVTFANVPTPGAVLLAACNLAQSSVLLAHLGASLARVFAGYLLAAALGIALGLAIGRSAWAEALLLPPLEVLRPIPAVAWIPLAILMFPSSEASMIFITFTGALFPILLNTVHGVEALDPRLLASARSLGAGRRPGDRHGHLLVLPGDRRDDLRAMGTGLLHLGFLQHPELRRGGGRHAAHRPLRHGQQWVGEARRRVADALVRGGRQGPMTTAGNSLGRIQIRDLSIRLGQGSEAFEAVRDLSLEARPGEFVCLLGPSGCGKSTLLGALAGHLRPSAGSVRVDGRSVEGPSPQRGMVFQQHTLFPWRRVRDNVAFGLKMQGLARAERNRRAMEMLGLVGLADFAGRWPGQLSGGMQQRVEIARVLVNRPRLLLMDEPFGALDAQTRLKMQTLLLDVWARVRTTVLFVTHDIDEALYLADRVLVMSPRPGRIIADLALDFPRPRDTRLVTSADFVRLKRHCLELLDHDDGRQLPRLTPLGLPPGITPDRLRIAI